MVVDNNAVDIHVDQHMVGMLEGHTQEGEDGKVEDSPPLEDKDIMVDDWEGNGLDTDL